MYLFVNDGSEMGANEKIGSVYVISELPAPNCVDEDSTGSRKIASE